MSDFWTILIILGAVQACFLAIILMTGKNTNPANKWLAAMLLALAPNLFEYSLSISGLVLNYPFILGTSYPFLFCIGPFFFIYVENQFVPGFRFSSKKLLHFIVPFLCLLLMLPFYLTPAAGKLNFIAGLEQNGSLQIPAGQYLFMVAHIVQTTFYFYLAYRLIRKTEIRFRASHSNPVFSVKITYMKGFSKVFLLWLAIYFSTTSLLFISKRYLVEIDYLTLLATSALMFVFSYTVLKNAVIFNESMMEEHVPNEFRLYETIDEAPARAGTAGNQEEEALETIRETALETEITRIKYKGSALTAEKTQNIKQEIDVYFSGRKPWHKYDLKLSEVANAISVPSHQISQVINQEFGLNFFDFVNSYRVDEAKKMLEDETRDHLKVMAIAFDVGFNSKATFNRVFKKFTSNTPSEYRKTSLDKQH